MLFRSFRFLPLAVLGSACLSLGFSPYEAVRLSGLAQRVGLFAWLDPEKVEAAEACVRALGGESRARLREAGVKNLQVFVREVGARWAVFLYFEVERRGVDGLCELPRAHAPEIARLESLITPHARAAEGEKWVRMEWINLIATDEAFPHRAKNVTRMGFMSGLRPERELTYRSLHQTNWPGVVDGMVASHYRNWTTFLIEDGEALYLFTYTEYIGTDIEQDNQRMAADPATRRWWRHTEPCLIDLHGEGNWSRMRNLTEGGR